jgi:hypothetical protein
MPSELEIKLEPLALARDYGAVSIRFTVTSVFDVTELDGGSYSLAERMLISPYEKDYDVEGEMPGSLAERFDITKWTAITAWWACETVGRAIVAWGYARFRHVGGPTGFGGTLGHPSCTG